MASLASSLHISGRNSPTNPPNQRITLIDNTTSLPPSEVASEAGDEPPAQPSSSSTVSSQKHPGRRETLRKAIAQRKYRRWSVDPFPSNDDSEENLAGPVEESPDPRAAGVVERVGEDQEIVVGGGGGDVDGTNEEPERRGRTRSDTGGNKKPNGEGAAERRTGRKKGGKEEKEIAEIDVLYENQRGMFICGIPLFSAKGLLNFDPAPWQNHLHHDSAVSIVNAQVPDPSWAWAWKTWYVDMTTDVDEEGWMYSFSFNPSFSWHGTHIWFHSFVRRRRWLRKRVKVHGHGSGSLCSSRDGSMERGHGLNQDYFTIHSHTKGANVSETQVGIGGSKKRRSVMAGAGWSWKDEDGDGRDDAEQGEDETIKDIPALMSALKSSRLDREKVEAVESFLRDGGVEVEYLTERIPDIMSLMIFQASRRQLLSLLITESEKAEVEANLPTPPPSHPTSPPPAPLPPSPSEPTTPLSVTSENPQHLLLPPSPSIDPPGPPAISLDPPTPEPQDDPETTQKAKEALRRKIETLKKAIKVAGEEVRRMEYWSDVAAASANGETPLEAWDELGLSGPTFTAGAGAGGKGVGSTNGRSGAALNGGVDWKGKGKDTS